MQASSPGSFSSQKKRGATEHAEGKETGGEVQDYKGRLRIAAPCLSLIFSSDLLSLSVLRGSLPFARIERPWRMTGLSGSVLFCQV